jgi:hypothetical protein
VLELLLTRGDPALWLMTRQCMQRTLVLTQQPFILLTELILQSGAGIYGGTWLLHALILAGTGCYTPRKPTGPLHGLLPSICPRRKPSRRRARPLMECLMHLPNQWGPLEPAPLTNYVVRALTKAGPYGRFDKPIRMSFWRARFSSHCDTAPGSVPAERPAARAPGRSRCWPAGLQKRAPP